MKKVQIERRGRAKRMLSLVLGVAILGGLGAVIRFGVFLGVQRIAGETFPWGTLVVNGIGCLLFGLLWAGFEYGDWLPRPARVMLLTGFMGALTTYSTFAFETASLLEEGKWLIALVNVLSQTFGGLLCMFTGIAAGKWLTA